MCVVYDELLKPRQSFRITLYKHHEGLKNNLTIVTISVSNYGRSGP